MISKAEIKCGDLFLADFNPGAGHEYQGKRPALVIESDKQIKKSNLAAVLPLTSNLDNRVVYDVFIKANEDNRLKFDSIIKVYDIISFDYSRFINKIGGVNQGILKKVRDYLLKHFDLS